MGTRGKFRITSVSVFAFGIYFGIYLGTPLGNSIGGFFGSKFLGKPFSFDLSTSLYASDRSRVIDFEDDVVEGVNKRPLDSVQQLSDADRRKRRSHLYRKRSGFKDEIEQALLHLRYR